MSQRKVNYKDLYETCQQRLTLAMHRVTILEASTKMLLTCPVCGKRHIDEGEFATKPHHTHACQFCGTVWRPAIGETVGVRFLPGFKDKEG